MQEVITFLVDNLDLVLSFVIGFLCFLLAWVRTGSLKKAIKQLKEYEDMIKYRVAEEAQAEKRTGQEFSNTVTDYILDPVTNELSVSPVPKDIQALIESYIDVALDRALEKFLPEQVVKSDDTVADYTQTSQDLAVMGEAFDLAEEYRQQYNLGDDLSVADIYKYVGEQADKMKNDLLNYQNRSKEVFKDGKTSETVEKVQ